MQGSSHLGGAGLSFIGKAPSHSPGRRRFLSQHGEMKKVVRLCDTYAFHHIFDRVCDKTASSTG